jgi:hypothetical protein
LNEVGKCLPEAEKMGFSVIKGYYRFTINESFQTRSRNAIFAQRTNGPPSVVPSFMLIGFNF